MGEKRAVRVSHELWRQIMTQGRSISGLFVCYQGIPEDATLAFATYAGPDERPDPIFVFESDNWTGNVGEWRVVDRKGVEYPSVHEVLFVDAECRTCKNWDPSSHKLSGECRLTRDDDYVPVHKESLARAVSSGDGPHPVSWLQTEAGFGCAQYEPKEPND